MQTAQNQELTVNAAEYEVVKNGSKWDVQCNGVSVEGCCHNTTKKAAVSDMEEAISGAVYRERILREDVTGHLWIADETKQIADYADVLVKNGPCNFNTSNQQEAGRKAHFSDMSTLLSHYQGFNGAPYKTPSHRGMLVCADVRRTRAARVLAFKTAGLTLSGDYFTVRASLSGEEMPSTSNHETRLDAEHHIEHLRRMATMFGHEEGTPHVSDPNTHTFNIEEVKEHFPFCCAFAVPTSPICD